MTAVLLALGAVPGFGLGWLVCTRWHQALRLDRDLHELDAHKNGDALHKTERRVARMIAHPGIATRAHRIFHGSPT